MSDMARLRREQIFHDRQAEERAAWFRRQPDALHFANDEYLDHESWVRPAFAALGNVAGKRVLDYGCGHGMAAVVLARQGAKVVACDLSLSYVREASWRGAANNAAVTVLQANAEKLPFADESFDALWGHAILHHLHIPSAAAEVQRILKPGGVAVCCEPWGGNPLLEWVRRHVPYPGKGRTPEEAPLRPRDVQQLKRFFPRLRLEGHHLLAMASRLVRGRRCLHQLTKWDRQLFHLIPGLQRWSRYVVLVLPKE